MPCPPILAHPGWVQGDASWTSESSVTFNPKYRSVVLKEKQASDINVVPERVDHTQGHFLASQLCVMSLPAPLGANAPS